MEAAGRAQSPERQQRAGLHIEQRELTAGEVRNEILTKVCVFLERSFGKGVNHGNDAEES